MHVLKSSNKSTMINDLIMNYSQRNAEKVDYDPVSHRDSETHAPQNGNLERHEVVKDRTSCSMSNMFQVSKTRRNILYLWKYAIRHHLGGQEAGRTTDQRSIHHVRPWNSRCSIEEYSKGSTLWKLCRIRKTPESQKLLGFRKETKLRNDRGALPRGRAVPKTNARTTTHAIRHGRI